LPLVDVLLQSSGKGVTEELATLSQNNPVALAPRERYERGANAAPAAMTTGQRSTSKATFAPRCSLGSWLALLNRAA
jgi:hypothetical protein